MSEEWTIRIAEAAAGAALGLFLGLLVGLTTSPVAAAVVGSITALATTFIGLGDKLIGIQLAPSTIRLCAFSLFAAGFMILGIHMRTHDLLAPTPKQMLDSLHAAQFSDRDALDLIRLARFGLLPAGATAAASDNPIVRREGTTLYSVPANVCTQMTRVHGADVSARIAVLSDVQKEMAQHIQGASLDRQPTLLDAAEFLLCGTR